MIKCIITAVIRNRNVLLKELLWNHLSEAIVTSTYNAMFYVYRHNIQQLKQPGGYLYDHHGNQLSKNPLGVLSIFFYDCLQLKNKFGYQRSNSV